MITRILANISALLALTCTVAAAQNAPPQPPGFPELIPLRLQVVVSKYNGAKKIASHPYELMVNANSRDSRDQTQVRMLSDVPYPTGKLSAGETHGFKTVGTAIDCRARSEGDAFQLTLSVNDSSIAYTDGNGPSPAGMTGVPRFRNFTTTNTLLMKNGETKQILAATDPIDGQVMRVDVTLNVVK